MSICIATLSSGDYWRGAQVLFKSLRSRCRLGEVRLVAFGDTADCVTEADERLPITKDYSKVQVNQKNFPEVAKKFFALTLPFDTIISMDADMLCVQDCSWLWTLALSDKRPFYAVRDTASYTYYRNEIERDGLDRNSIFNAGTMIFTGGQEDHALRHQLLLRFIRAGLASYDGGDQGYFNSHFARQGVGFLPNGYNYVLDPLMPQLPPYEQYIVHFTGANAKPWLATRPSDWRTPYYRQWDEVAASL